MNARIPWTPSKQQKKAMDDKIKQMSSEITLKIGNNIDASVLWTLHRTFGYGKKRLRRYFLAFVEERKKLAECYEMEDQEEYLCKVKLKEIGVDVEAWNKELDRKLNLR